MIMLLASHYRDERTETSRECKEEMEKYISKCSKLRQEVNYLVNYILYLIILYLIIILDLFTKMIKNYVLTFRTLILLKRQGKLEH